MLSSRLVGLALTSAVVLGGVAAPPSLAADAATTDAPISLTVERPTGRLSGVVPVPVHVSAAEGVRPERLVVTIGPSWGTVEQGGVRTRSVELALDPSCATSCDVVAEVDTVTWLPPADGAMVDTTLDESAWQLVAVEAFGVQTAPDGTTAPVRVRDADGANGFTVDNGRPSTSCSAPGLPYDYQGYSDAAGGTPVRFLCDVTPGRSSAALDRVEVQVHVAGVTRRYTARADAAIPSRSLPLDIVTADLPDGIGWISAVAVDTEGLRSSRSFLRLSTFRPTTTVAPTVRYGRMPGVSESSVEVVVARPPSPSGGLTRISAVVDGGLVLDEERPAQPDRPGDPLVLEVPLTDGRAPLSAGRHVLAVTTEVVTGRDHRGESVRTLTTTTRQTITALAAGITVTPRGWAVAGGDGRLDVTVTGALDTPGSRTPTPLRRWSVSRWNGLARVGTPLAAGECDGACPATSFPVALGGLPGHPDPGFSDHTLRIEVVDAIGRTTQRDVRVHVDARTRLRVLAPAASSYGRTAPVRVFASGPRTESIGGLPVELQQRPSAGGTWTTAATGTTGPLGEVVFDVPVTGSTRWRAVSPGKVGLAGPATSGQDRTAVATAVVVRGVPTSGAVQGRAYPVAVSVQPPTPGVRLTVETRRDDRSWSTARRLVTGPDGTATTMMAFPPGYTGVRVLSEGTATTTPGRSGEQSVVLW